MPSGIAPTREEEEDEIMPAPPSPQDPRQLTESDIRDPERAMVKHLSALDARMEAQTVRVNGAASRAHRCVERLKNGGSTRFSLKPLQEPDEPCWKLGGAGNGQSLKPCLHDPLCSQFEKARKALLDS